MRLTATSNRWRCCLWMALPAAWVFTVPVQAQPTSTPLASLYNKTALTPADLTVLQNRVTDITKAMVDTVSRVSSSDRERETARRRAVDELKQGTPAFRAAAAAALAGKTQPHVNGSNLQAAISSLLVINEINHPAARLALLDGLNSPMSGVRFLAARGLRDLQAQLTAPADYEPVIKALADAAKVESNGHVLRTLYEALDFDARQRNFRGKAEIAAALSDVFKAHLARLAYSPREDAAGIELAERLGPTLDRTMVDLARSLYQLLLRTLEMARADPTGSDVLLVAQIENAIHKVVDKHTPAAASVPRLAAAFAGGKVDAAKLNAAKDALVGSKDRPGVLRGQPWALSDY